MSHDNAGRKPFLFVGTAKAGTTSIFNYLLQHPALHIPKKETFYFLRDIYQNIDLPYPQQRSIETMVLEQSRYKELYKDTGARIHGEIGTGYLFHHEVSIPRIKEEFGEEVNILIILREPVDRAFSSYNHFVKDMHETLSFEEALDAEQEREDKGWDFMWRHRALGLYADQVKAFQDSFSNVKILLYDNLKKDPKRLMDDVFEFIGVDAIKELDTKKQFNPSGQPRNKTIQKLLIHENPLKKAIRPIVRFIMSNERRERIRKDLKSRNLKDYGSMQESTKQELKAFYSADIEKLERISGLDLSIWK